MPVIPPTPSLTWFDQPAQQLNMNFAIPAAHVYRVEIGGEEDVSYIEAASLRDAIHTALYGYPDAPQVNVFAERVAAHTTLAQFAADNPGLFD